DAMCQTVGNKLRRTFEINNAYVSSVGAEDFAIGLPERGAGNYRIDSAGDAAINQLPYPPQPWNSILISQRNALVHLVAVGSRMQIVAVIKLPSDCVRQQRSNGGFSRS